MKYDITVIGSCSIDNIYYANKNNIFPDKPTIIVPGGKGSNQAVAASRSGSKVNIISILNDNKLLDNLKINNINTSNIERTNIPDDTSNIYINYINKDNKVIRTLNTSNLFTIDFIKRHLTSILNSKMVLAQTKIPKETTNYIINFCYENNIPIIITPSNPNNLDINIIDKITYITANRKECKKIFNTEDINYCLEKYPNKLIVTLGPDGVSYHNNNKIIHYNAISMKNIKDTIGAGDTFTGNLATLLIEGNSLDKSIYLSQYASSLKLLKRSPQEGMPTKEERDNFINKKQ